MAFEDKSVSGLAAEAEIAATADKRLDATAFATALTAFIKTDALPTARWTKGLATVAAAGPEQSDFVQRVLTDQLDFDPNAPPRDIGGIVELLCKICVAIQTKLRKPEALLCLQNATGGGKLKTIGKKLVQMLSDTHCGPVSKNPSLGHISV